MLHASLALVAVAMRVAMALVDSETMVRADAAALTVVASVIALNGRVRLRWHWSSRILRRFWAGRHWHSRLCGLWL